MVVPRVGALLFGLLPALPGSCLCPPRAEDLLAVGFRTPRQTLATFQTYLRADLSLQEYLCFSDRFRAEHGLSAVTYGEGRERLFREKPWLKLFVKAEVIGEGSEGESEHWIDVRVLASTIRVRLVREPFFEIWSGEELLADGYGDFDRWVDLAGNESRTTLSVRIPLEDPPAAYPGLSEVIVARPWKIDALHEIETESEPAP